MANFFRVLNVDIILRGDKMLNHRDKQLDCLENSRLFNVDFNLFGQHNQRDLTKSILHTYHQYPLLQHFIRDLPNEDKDIKDIDIFDTIDQLKSKTIYLYVITVEGKIWFVSRCHHDQFSSITHAALLRKAIQAPNNMAVLAAGEVAINIINNNSIYINLASGHFTPELVAYIPAIQAFQGIAGDKEIHIQMSHYKSLDTSSAMRCEKRKGRKLREFINTLLYDVQDLTVLLNTNVEYLTSDKIDSKQNVESLIKIYNKLISGNGYSFQSKNDLITADDFKIITQHPNLFELINKNLQYCSEELQALIAVKAQEDKTEENRLNLAINF